jgi:rubrerythrin
MKNTQQNLLKAFAGESQARNKYTIFAKMARKENFEWIARIFEETADNERAHAEELFELIEGDIKMQGELSISPFKKTSDNLKMAAAGEKYEWTTMYPDFEKVAIQEKQEKAAKLFGSLKLVEEKHEERYIIIAKKLDSKTLYDSNAELEWKCLNCGYIHKGKKPPVNCPVCKKAFTWYMPLGLVR